jgi:hypothetical protein
MERISPILDLPIENQVKYGYQDEPERVFGRGLFIVILCVKFDKIEEQPSNKE